jgi:pheromone a factor receptor
MIRRAQFSQIVTSNNALTMNRYFRLMCLAMAEVFITIPLSSLGLYLNLTSRPIYPWKSWSDTHLDWYTIDVYPAVLWRSNRVSIFILELNRWSLVLSALVFFAFFGFAEESRKNYRRLYSLVLKWLGMAPGDQLKQHTSTSST